jgi:hypothetical protein
MVGLGPASISPELTFVIVSATPFLTNDHSVSIETALSVGPRARYVQRYRIFPLRKLMG